MAEIAYTPEEVVEIWFVPTLTAPAAPSAAEIAAGTRLTAFATDGGEWPFAGNFVNSGTLISGFESQVPSTRGGQNGSLTLIRKRDTATQDATADDAYELLTRGTVGYFVVADYGVSGVSGAPATGDVLHVYEIEIGSRQPVRTRGSLMTFDIQFAFLSEPNENVVAAA